MLLYPSRYPSHSLCMTLFMSWRVFAQSPEAPFAIPNYLNLQDSPLPGTSTWAALNTTLGGRLQDLRPWAAVCYINDPSYDPVTCKTVLSEYKNHHMRDSIPSALIWPNWESCGYNRGCALDYFDPQPVSDGICHQGTTPSFSVTILSAQDASDVVNWAAIHNITLTIKNTGHDYLGRSTRHSSLQVLTHELNSVEYLTNFVPQGSSARPVPAIKVGAGAQLEAIYSVAEKYRVSVVLGNCLTVGAAGGYIQGGGHSMLTPAYGLAVDNLLEVEIVTADGIIRTINDIQDPDLFWAVSGGGAGNWGIIISVTLAALPPTPISASSLVIAPNPTRDSHTLGVSFIELMGKYQNRIINSGIASFFMLYEGSYNIGFLWPAEKASVSLLHPLFEEIRALSDDYTVLFNATQESMYSSISTAILEGIGPIADATTFYGSETQISSRLVPQSALENSESIHSVAEAIWKGAEFITAPADDYDSKVVFLLYGGMPAATKQRVNETGANPGLYDAAWHAWYIRSWSGIGVDEKAYLSMSQSIYDAVGPMTAIGLTSSYQNEANVWEPNWKEAFFGYKYDRLLEIKRRYDPANFFTTYKAVGSMPDSAMYSCYHQADQWFSTADKVPI